jgi:hypothetical protein
MKGGEKEYFPLPWWERVRERGTYIRKGEFHGNVT